MWTLVNEDKNSAHSDQAATEHGAGNDVSYINNVADRCRISSHGISPFGMVVTKNKKSERIKCRN